MKKLLFLATMFALGMTACQKTDVLENGTNDGTATVTVTAALPAQLDETRVAGDGTTVDRCIMQIYLDNQPYGERQYAQVQGLKATFSARLVAGKTYDLVFWADKMGTDLKTDLHYNTADFAHVAFIGDYAGNDESRDAFFGSAQVVADQSKAVSVELRRPFGQLNVKTLDLAEVKAAAPTLEPKMVKVAFKNVPTEIDLTTGELATTTQAVAYVDAVALAGTNGELTVDYVFAPKAEGEQYLTDFTMSFLDANKAQVAADYEFTNIPVQRNYRTNVSGNLLTKKADINVTVVPEFDGVINQTITEVKSIADLNNFLFSGGTAKLEQDLTIAGTDMIMSFKEVNLDLNGHTLTFANENGNTCGYNIYQNTTISNGKIVAKMNSEEDAPLVCGSGYSVTLDGVEFESEASCIGTASNVSNAEITIRNSTLKCGCYAVSTIAASPVGTGIKITIEGSTLEALTPVLVNVPCDLTIDDCQITALMQGMILRGGTANVSNSTFTFDTDASFTGQADAEEFANAFLSSDWGTGNMVNLAAITAGNKGEGSYQYPTVLNLKNTTVETTGAYASLFPAMYVWANQGEGLGVTINYDEQCTFTGGITYGSKNIVVNGVEQ